MCVLPEFVCWNLTSKETALRSETSRRQLGYDSLTLMNKSPSKKGLNELWRPSFTQNLARAIVCVPFGGCINKVPSRSREQPSPADDSACPLILDFSASRTWSNNFFLFIDCPIWGLIASQMD